MEEYKVLYTNKSRFIQEFDYIENGERLYVKHYDEIPKGWNPDGYMNIYMGCPVIVKEYTDYVYLIIDNTFKYPKPISRIRMSDWNWNLNNFERRPISLFTDEDFTI